MSGRLKFACLNLSPSLPDSAVAQIAQATRIYTAIVAEERGELAPLVEFIPGLKVAPAGWIANIFAATMDEPGALAYHWVDPLGRPYIRNCLAAIPGHVILHDQSGHGASLCGGALHEAAEVQGDRRANRWAKGPVADPRSNKKFSLVAEELCDPNQDAAVPLKLADGTLFDAPDFVFDDFFNFELLDEGPQPLSWLASINDSRGLMRPLSVGPGGYLITANIGAENNVFGRTKVLHATVDPAAWRTNAHHESKRSSRRLCP